MNTNSNMTAVVPKEGWHALHQIYSINLEKWGAVGIQDKHNRIEQLQSLINSIRATENYQISLFSIIGKADFGILLIGPDLQQIDLLEKQLKISLGPDVIITNYSFLSLTEESEYKMTEEEYGQHITKTELLQPGTLEYDAKIKSFIETTKKYSEERIYPQISDWKTICFYPMAKRRNADQNWYALDYNQRRDLMKGHGVIGRKYTGRVKQIITGAVGLSDWEWGVTLFANDISYFKDIIYEMRFDPVTHQYGEFGPFYIGLLMNVNELCTRLNLVEKTFIEV